MNFSLIGLTTAHMGRPRFHTEREFHFRPTEASACVNGVKYGKCIRATYLRATGEPSGNLVSPSAEWAGLLGKAIEEINIEQWKQMGIWVDNNVKWYDKERNLSGELDVLLRAPDNEIFVAEVKSLWGYRATTEICGSFRTKGSPKIEHLMQVMTYLGHLRDRIPYAKMLYYARDSSKKAEFNITLVDDPETKQTHANVNGYTYNQFSLQDIYNRYAEANSYIQQKTLPPNDYVLQYPDSKVEALYAQKKVADSKYKLWKKGKGRVGDFQCSYCSYLPFCWAEGPANEEETIEEPA